MNDHDILQDLPDRPLLRIGEVAHFFSVSPQEIYQWYDSGVLKGRKHKGVIQISRASVIDLIRKNEGRRGRVPI
ncbi:MAG: Helix-turn-helix domain [Nitrospirae bacterium]|nr:Helix-turn-helix domain [Nitrospirota bacterium]